MQKEVVIILDNVRSAHNVGSVFRTADGAGVSKLYLGGITPTPVDRFGRAQPEIEKTSLGATHTVAWEQVGDGTSRATEDLLGLMNQLQTDGYTVVAIEQVPEATPLFEYETPHKVAYIFGAEVEGVQPAITAAADGVVHIPMHGTKESLNVSVTVGIVLFQRN